MFHILGRKAILSYIGVGIGVFIKIYLFIFINIQYYHDKKKHIHKIIFQRISIS